MFTESLLTVPSESQLFYWVILPVVAALMTAAVSVYCVARDPQMVQFLLGTPILFLHCFSLWILCVMISSVGWFTSLPHFVIGFTFPLVALQYWLMCTSEEH